jgi:hypothetical protein
MREGECVSEKFVTIARQRDALIAVVSLATEEESGLRCTLVPRRIEGVGESVCPSAPAVAQAWRTLARARVDDAEGLAAALVVLIETVPLDLGSGPTLCRPAPVSEVRRRPLIHVASSSSGTVAFLPPT